MKEKMKKIPGKLKAMLKENRAVIAFTLCAVLLAVPTMAASSSMIDVSGVDFKPILDEILSLLPVLLPVIISFLAIRKGISFLLGMLRGA